MSLETNGLKRGLKTVGYVQIGEVTKCHNHMTLDDSVPTIPYVEETEH